MLLIKHIALSHKNRQIKNLATAILTVMDQKKKKNWNKTLVEEIGRKTQQQISKELL